MTEAAPPRVRSVATALVVLQLLLVFGGWLYRSTLYWKIPVHPGDPYGLGDLIDLGFFVVLLGSSALTLLVALVFAAKPSLRHPKTVYVLMAAGLLAAPLYGLVHPHLPQVMRARPPPAT